MRGRLAIASFFSVLLLGCSTIHQVVPFGKSLLVKIPTEQTNPHEIVTADWTFTHVAEAPILQDGTKANWFLATPKTPPLSQRAYWDYAIAQLPNIALAVHQEFHVWPLAIEVNLKFEHSQLILPKNETVKMPPQPTKAVASLKINAPTTPMWPVAKTVSGSPNLLWQLDDNYSQLRTASARVGKQAQSSSLIAILDSGFARAQAGVPLHLIDTPKGDAADAVPPRGQVRPGLSNGSHGTGTLGILAGRNAELYALDPKQVEYTGQFGGAPDSRVLPVRVAPQFVSLTTAQLAYGIDYASRVEGADVISMSHGGSPSMLWADTVNAAYARGTPMIAAEGDFISAFGTDLGVVIPSSPVYPAEFRRVLGVTAATANKSTYAKNSILRLIFHSFTFSKPDAWKSLFFNVDGIKSWCLRGSYGADMSIHRPWPFGLLERSDASEEKLGILRSQPIAGYSPNVPWLRSLSNDERGANGRLLINLVDLDGSGTSAATPQVAAAAALWLSKNRSTIEKLPVQKRWQKAEAVYFALLKSAERKSDHPDHYLGAGMLKANDALNISFQNIVSGRENIKNGDKWLLRFPTRPNGAPSDHYDAQRAFWGIVNPFAKWCPISSRADPDQRIKTQESTEEALTKLYYNTLLLRAWHSNKMPAVKQSDGYPNIEPKLHARAQQAAQAAIKSWKVH